MKMIPYGHCCFLFSKGALELNSGEQVPWKHFRVFSIQFSLWLIWQMLNNVLLKYHCKQAGLLTHAGIAKVKTIHLRFDKPFYTIMLSFHKLQRGFISWHGLIFYTKVCNSYYTKTLIKEFYNWLIRCRFYS